MSGQNSSSSKKIARRDFLKLTAAGALVAGLGSFATRLKAPLKKINKNIPGKILGASHQLGHLIREKKHLPADSTSKTPLLIIGGGVAGLSAGWWLKRNGFHNFKIIELESEVGGNSRSGRNQVSAYPWGAHYLPLPNKESTYVFEILKELGVLTGTDSKGLPIYNEDHLCFDPQERLFFEGTWQDGLVPSNGLNPSEHLEMKKFHELTESFKNSIGSDKKKAFAIPLALSSQDPKFLKLDLITMKDFLESQGFHSKPLHWYVNYCCRDDYGATYDNVSAWAGLHYFSGRSALASNAHSDTVLTWPEGNSWITRHLRDQLKDHIQTDSMALSIESVSGRQKTKVLSTLTQKIDEIESQQLIYCAPNFTWKYLYSESKTSPHFSKVEYDPWLVANITVTSRPAGKGAPLSWDNVSYYSPSLGYINATHQNLEIKPEQSVLTYYLPLSDLPPKEARTWALQRSHQEWISDIIDDLENMHEGLSHYVSQMDVWLWGHAMIRPSPGYIWGPERAKLQKSLDSKIHFAHSDLSGISIFEEAQFQGVEAAKKVLLARKSLDG